MRTELMHRAVVALATFAAAAASATAKPVPPLSELVFRSWNAIEPGRDTVCADGSPYRFHVKPGAQDRLVIFFNGGGACWSAETCDPQAKRETPVYVPTTAPPFNDPGNASGIFDDKRADNPLREWSKIFVSYCTGDVHIGARRTVYALAKRRFAIEHKGYANASAALRWTFRNYPSANTVLVAGSSAGAVAAPFYAGTIAQRYPGARVSVFADAAGAYRTKAIPVVFARWGADDVAARWIRARGTLPLNVETFFKVNATAFPQVPQAQYNNAADRVQGMFLKLLGEAADVQTLLRANLQELHGAIPGFRSYTAPGTQHTVLRRPEFFSDNVEGMPLTRWLADFAQAKPVANADCARDAAGCGAKSK